MPHPQPAPADTGNQAARAGWTKPFYGLSHFKTADPKRWATVADRGHRAELTCWRGGGLCDTVDATFTSVDAAMAAGEHWAKTGALQGVAA